MTVGGLLVGLAVDNLTVAARHGIDKGIASINIVVETFTGRIDTRGLVAQHLDAIDNRTLGHQQPLVATGLTIGIGQRPRLHILIGAENDNTTGALCTRFIMEMEGYME